MVCTFVPTPQGRRSADLNLKHLNHRSRFEASLEHGGYLGPLSVVGIVVNEELAQFAQRTALFTTSRQAGRFTEITAFVRRRAACIVASLRF